MPFPFGGALGALGLGQFARGGLAPGGPPPGGFAEWWKQQQGQPPIDPTLHGPWEGEPIQGGGFDRAAYDQRYQRGLIPGSPGYEASVQQNPGIDPQTGRPWQATDQGGWGQRMPPMGQGQPWHGGQPGMWQPNEAQLGQWRAAGAPPPFTPYQQQSTMGQGQLPQFDPWQGTPNPGGAGRYLEQYGGAIPERPVSWGGPQSPGMLPSGVPMRSPSGIPMMGMPHPMMPLGQFGRAGGWGGLGAFASGVGGFGFRR